MKPFHRSIETQEVLVLLIRRLPTQSSLTERWNVARFLIVVTFTNGKTASIVACMFVREKDLHASVFVAHEQAFLQKS